MAQAATRSNREQPSQPRKAVATRTSGIQDSQKTRSAKEGQDEPGDLEEDDYGFWEKMLDAVPSSGSAAPLKPDAHVISRKKAGEGGPQRESGQARAPKPAPKEVTRNESTWLE